MKFEKKATFGKGQTHFLLILMLLLFLKTTALIPTILLKQIIDFLATKKIALGKNISRNKTMSCATCHNPNKAYTDGLKFSTDNLGKQLTRNTPTLLNSSFQKAFFWEGRSSTLEDQINAVFKNKKEFNTTIHQFSDEILTDSTYINLFKDSFGSVPISNREVVKAVASFVATLKSFNSKFDRNIRGEENSFSPEEKKDLTYLLAKRFVLPATLFH